MKSKGPGENNLKATSANFSATSVRLTAGPLESYSGNVSNQDTTSKQHHSNIDKYRLKRKEKNKSREEIFYQMKVFF